MGKLRAVLWLCLALAATALLVCADAMATVSPPARQATGRSDYAFEQTKKIVSLVNRAVKAIETEGEAAFAEMNRADGPWRAPDGSLYVFVRDAQGIQVVNSVFPEMIGKDTKRNSKRAALSQQKLLAGPEPDTWFHYIWKDPNTGQAGWKSAYLHVARTPEGKLFVVGAGMIGLPMERRFVEDLVNEAAELLAKEGKMAFAALADPEGPFRFNDSYVFVDAPDYVELFNPAFPVVVGHCFAEATDNTGAYFVRQYVDKALRDGSGWTRYNWPKPGSTKPSPKYTYTRKTTMDGQTVVVGMGLYLDYPLDLRQQTIEKITAPLAQMAGKFTVYQQDELVELLRGFLVANPELSGASWSRAPMARGDKKFVEAQVITRGGNQMKQTSLTDLPYQRAVWLHPAADQGQAAWSKPYYNVVDDNYVKMISYAAPVQDDQGQIVAYVSGDLAMPQDLTARQADLAEITGGLQGQIEAIMGEMGRSAQALRQSGPRGAQAQKILDAFYQDRPYMFSAVTIDADNVLRCVAPAAFQAAVGKKTGDPASADQARRGDAAILTKPFTMAEGFVANALTQRLGGGGQTAGCLLSVTFNLADFVVEAIPAHFQRNVFILRADDGFFVYSNRREDIHRSVLLDPKFQRRSPELAKLGQTITASASGQGRYVSADLAGKPVGHQCLWRTVNFADQQWRVVLTWED